jgi:hypothetical protein
VIVSVWFMVDALANQFKTSLMALAITAAGIPFYLIWRVRDGRRPPDSGTLS